MKILKKIKEKIKAVGNYAFAFAPVILASSSTTDVIMDWMPTIITFAMLGMVLGLLKKFGKF